MRLYLTETKPHCVVLEETGFHLVFLPTHSSFSEPSVGVAVWAPGEHYPHGEQEGAMNDIAGCLGLLRFEGRNLLLVVKLPLESVGLEEECRRLEHVLWFDLDEPKPISLSCHPLNNLLQSGHYYLSKTFDLTKTLSDNLHDARQLTEACQPKSRVDKTPTTPPCPHHHGIPRYVWNTHLLEPLLALRDSLDAKHQAWFDSRSFALPIIEGFYGQKRIRFDNGEKMTVTVVSRHARQREGTRFEKRGIDSEGNVAQFVESETTVETESKTVSFVQVRGSVPLYWKEKPSTHTIKLDITLPPSKSIDPFLVHFRTLVARFGDVHALSLLHSHDTPQYHPEDDLSDAYAELAHLARAEDQDLRKHLTYQQHSINRDGAFVQVPSGIVKAVSPLIDKVGTTTANVDKKTGKLELEKEQNGIFRINCRDCCDRTTLGQWSVATEAINREMDKMDMTEEAKESVTKAIGELWADNGNALAQIYTGGNALWTRFIRTGVYSKVEEGIENAFAAETRMISHRLHDKEKNRAMEILTGERKDQEPTPKLILISHPDHPLLPKPLPPPSSFSHSDSEDGSPPLDLMDTVSYIDHSGRVRATKSSHFAKGKSTFIQVADDD